MRQPFQFSRLFHGGLNSIELINTNQTKVTKLVVPKIKDNLRKSTIKPGSFKLPRPTRKAASVLPTKLGKFSSDEVVLCHILRDNGYDPIGISYMLGCRSPQQIKAFFEFPPEEFHAGPWSYKEASLLEEAVTAIKAEPGDNFKTISSFWHEVSLRVETRTPLQCRHFWEASTLEKPKRYGFTKEADLEILRQAAEKVGALNNPTGILSSYSPTLLKNRYQVLKFNRSIWSDQELLKLEKAIFLYGPSDWKKIEAFVKTRRAIQCQHRWTPNRYLNSINSTKDSREFDWEEIVILRGLTKRFASKLTWIRTFLPGRSLPQVKLQFDSIQVPKGFEFPQNSDLFSLFLEAEGDCVKLAKHLGDGIQPRLVYERIRKILIIEPKQFHAKLIHDRVKKLFEERKRELGTPKSWKID